jgi:hypothetical protein
LLSSRYVERERRRQVGNPPHKNGPCPEGAHNRRRLPVGDAEDDCRTDTEPRPSSGLAATGH